MRKGFRFPVLAEVAIGALLLGLLVGVFGFIRTLRYGFSAHDAPTGMEAFLAGRMRHWSIPAELHKKTNPIPVTPETLAEGRAHFADHCASCHGNDGKGKTEMGQHLYPRAPDMTLPETQSQSDGELFATIENGVRLTGMPGWGNGTAGSASGSWTLVHFIRHLPKITPEEIGEMEKLNPKSPEEWQQMQQEAAFLAGGDEAAPASTNETQPHHH
jgi:mono/diheme cytochrome c family protein